MKKQSASRVRISDKMVLIGLGLGALYWFLDTFLFIFISYDIQLFGGFLGVHLSEVWGRVIVCCLFVIFGSHAQFTINNRKVIEEAIRKREERYRTIIENTEDGYYEVTVKGGLIFFNDSICQISGYSKENLLEMSIHQILDEKSDRILLDSFETIRETGIAIKAVEWTLLKKNGEKCFVESSISMIRDANSQPTGFKGFLRDVTKRKRSEALKQEKIAAEAASKSKSEFLANMSHEIRTPMNSIIGLAELMMETDMTPSQKEDLSVINAAAHSLLALINDILDFSKIEAGKLALETVCFPIRDFLGESLRIMASKAHEKRIELAFRVAPDVPESLLGDPDRFRQIVLNLVGNALKFTEIGEVIVEVELEKKTDDTIDLHFSVRDTGIGIPKEKHSGIFDTFAQADGSTSRRYGGTGLGLAVSSQLVDLMGGRIWVESEPGQGSTFHFTACFTVGEDEKCQIAPEPAGGLGGLRALVVDDNDSSKHIIRELLEGWGMTAVTASGSDEARGHLEPGKESDGRFDLAVIDADMPNPDGVFLARWIRTQKRLEMRLVVLMTPSALKSRPLLEDLGVKGFALKPINPPELLNAIMLALGKTPLTPEITQKSPEALVWENARPLHILVAEDTPFNQKFITRLLERWNHTSVIAENGIMALEILDRESFDLVFMDVQMPEMDGFETTHAIREREKQTGGHIPIIAMTAHVMKGDRERCIEAGMDDYVAKPISREALLNAIHKLTQGKEGKGTGGNQPPEVTESSDTVSSFDRNALLDAFDHDMDFLKETIGMLLEDAPPMIEEIREALETGDADRLKRTAHALKGMVGNFQAKTVAQAALALETMGRQGELTDAEEAYETLVGEMDRFTEEIIKLT